jgi:cell division septation protein DedD
MANERNPNDPYRSTDDELGRQSRLETELQADPELAEGPAGGIKVAMFALAIAIILGAVFYGLNNSSINQAGTSSTAQNSSQTSAPATPRANTNPGTTTGSAPAQTQPAPAPSSPMSAPSNPPASTAPAGENK